MLGQCLPRPLALGSSSAAPKQPTELLSWIILSTIQDPAQDSFHKNVQNSSLLTGRHAEQLASSISSRLTQNCSVRLLVLVDCPQAPEFLFCMADSRLINDSADSDRPLRVTRHWAVKDSSPQFLSGFCSVMLLGLFFFHLSSAPSAAASHGIAVGESSDSTYALENSVRRSGVDSALRKYAFLALSGAKTGIIYNVTLAPTLDGIRAQAIRLRSGSLKKRGLPFNEISIPPNSTFNASHSSVLMIYRSIFNFTVYSLPAQYEFGGPVVGIITFSPSNFTIDDHTLPELALEFPNRSISIHPPLSRSVGSATPLCAFFSANGTITFDNVTSSPNVCTSATLGDVALVLPISTSPPPQSPTPAPTSPVLSQSGTKDSSTDWKLIVAITCLSLAGVAFCVAITLLGVGLARRMKVAIVSRLSDSDEALETSLIGISRAPAATVVRTKPALEVDLARF